MLTAFYNHRLPADYDTEIIHARARKRGALWDVAPDLIYKAFLLREAGHFGANESNYGSLYLWSHDAALRDFISGGRYRNVTNAFGRAPICIESALDARKGPAATARFAYLDTVAIDSDADLDETLANEIARNRDAAHHPDVAATVVSVDARQWILTRTRLSSDAPDANHRHAGTPWQILHLAQPLLVTLPGHDTLREER